MIPSFGERVHAVLSDRRRGASCAAAVAVLVYLQALLLGFAYDDVLMIRDNASLHGWSGIVSSLTVPYWSGRNGAELGLWRPLTTAWWGVQWMAWGDRPALFHAVGIALHALASGLLVVVLSELVPVGAAVLAGIVFALHPVHVEAVANVAGNAEPIVALFVLSACWVHLRSGDVTRWGTALGLGALFAAGASAKEIGFTLPVLLFLLDASRRDVGLGQITTYLARRWRLYLVLCVVTTALFLARASILGGVAPEQVPTGASRIVDVGRLWTVPDIWRHYVRLMFFPLDLSPEYGGIIPVSTGWYLGNAAGVVLALALLAMAMWAWRTGEGLAPQRSSRRLLGWAVVWFGLTVLPVANILFQSGILLAERNLYLPSVGFAAAAGWLVHLVYERRRSEGLAILVVIAAAFALRIVTATPRWDSTEEVFADLMERHPEVGRAWYFYGDMLFKSGRGEEARRAFARYLLLDDSEYTAATEVGARLSAMDGASPRAAAFLLERAWREKPGSYTAPGYLAAHHLNHAEFAEGEPAARAAVILAPDNLDMERVLAGLLSGQGRAAEAIPYRLDAIARGPSGPWRQWVWLADDYLTTGDTARAGFALDSARVRAPGPDVIAAIDARLGEIGVAPRTE